MISFKDIWREKKAAGHKFATLTAYDYPTGRLLDGCELDFILVGDSLGMVELGFPDTTHATMDAMVHHTAAVARGATITPVISDLPAHSIDTPELAVENSLRLLAAGAVAVKLEGGSEVVATVKSLVEEGIQVVGHIGMLPQRVREEGGYRVKGKTELEFQRLQDDAQSLVSAGVAAIVLELVIPPLAARITEQIPVPTIGIGSGKGCDGQILVSHDLFGLSPWFVPGFVKPRADIASEIQRAAQAFVKDCREG